jgi:flavin-dependent dehydrogenase
MKLKQRGTSVPTLEKAQSVIDENVSEHLIAQAFEVMFKEFDRYIKIMQRFKGVDWTIYVKMRNKERKDGDGKMEFEDEPLLDEEEDEEPVVEEAEPAATNEEEEKTSK